MMRIGTLIATLWLIACSGETVTTAAAEEEVRNPLDFRRTTLIVRDIEASLALYRDALGMTVAYDEELTSPGLSTRFGADGVNRSRLVLLKANDDYIGMLGLWQFLDQTEADRSAPDPADFTPGDIVLLFNTQTLEETFARAATAPGVSVIGEPKERRYPSPAGDIVVMVSMLTDNDGHTIELNQLLEDPRRD
ncbi:VOC family protein [Parvularcula lutaonensis]|uniref:VOC family protein n=1 Tax=Parvularcula lutaonensis TaxID=491923 RepID=A0ABV7MAU3_9PROT|nr:VOC family protein [Parvularcula lutaonensis]